MIVSLYEKIGEGELANLREFMTKNGFSATEVSTQSGRYLVAVGGKEIDIRSVGKQSGVVDVHYVSDSYQLASRQWKVGHSTIHISEGVSIGGGFAIIGGPCSIEDREQVVEMCSFLKAEGVSMMRGGAFKPRSSPYSFRGLGLEGLKMFAEEAHQWECRS